MQTSSSTLQALKTSVTPLGERGIFDVDRPAADLWFTFCVRRWSTCTAVRSDVVHFNGYDGIE